MHSKFLSPFIATLLFFLLPPSHAQGIGVNRKILELTYEYVSMTVPTFTIVHEYSSRKRYVNSLGVGWCNAIHLPKSGSNNHSHFDIENRLVFGEKTLELQICGTESEFATPVKFKLPDGLNGENIVNLPPRSAGKARHSIEADGVMRMLFQAVIYSDGIDILDKSTGVVVSYGVHGGLEKIGELQVSRDDQGRVTKIYDSTNIANFIYNGNRLSKIENNKGNAALFKYGHDGNVSEIDNAWLKKTKFQYSQMHNLETIELSSGQSYTIFYNEEKDFVRGVLLNNGCAQEFVPLVSDNPQSYKIHSELACEGMPKKMETEQFDFSETATSFEALFGSGKSTMGTEGSLYKK